MYFKYALDIDWCVYLFFHLASVVLILGMVVMVLFSARKYSGVIAVILTYLMVGIVINALLSVTELLRRVVGFSSFERIGEFDYADLVRSAFVAFAFCMLAVGFLSFLKFTGGCSLV